MRIVPEVSYPEFNSLLGSCFPDEQIDEQVFRNNISRDQFLFVTDASNLAGYALFDLQIQPARLVQLCVSEACRNLGIGSFLINQLKQKLAEHNISELILHVDFENKGAIRFYKKHGFINDYIITQFLYQPLKKPDLGPSTLSIHQITEPLLIKEELHIGEFMTNYICQSSNNQVYVIDNEYGRVMGHFLYNPKDIKISHFMLTNSRLIDELIPKLFDLIPPNTELLIESHYRNMDNYLSQIPGMIIKYRLQVMRSNFLTKSVVY